MLRSTATSATTQQGPASRDGLGEYLDELHEDYLGIIGSSPAIVALRSLIRRVAASDRPVLISGPAGAGKLLVADAIHRLGASGRAGAPLLRVSCAAIPEQELGDILFGSGRTEGVMSAAGGSLILDDVEALSPRLQARLAFTLQSGGLRVAAPPHAEKLPVRLLAVTSRSLQRCVREQTFRTDLYHALSALTVPVPGLDEHKQDIPALVNHFLRLGRSSVRFAPEALDLLSARSWPGGVRELKNVVDRAAVMAEEPLIDRFGLDQLFPVEPVEQATTGSLDQIAGLLLELPVRNKLAAFEAAVLERAMRTSGGNKSAAARMLGLHRKAVERKVGKYGVPPVNAGRWEETAVARPAVAAANGTGGVGAGEAANDGASGGRVIEVGNHRAQPMAEGTRGRTYAGW